MTWFEKHWEALTVGGVVGLLGLLVWKEVSAAPSIAPVAPPANPITPSNTPSGTPATTWTLPAGQSGSTVINVPTGAPVTLFLPSSGGVWNSLTLSPGGPVTVNGAEAATFNMNMQVGGQGTATAIWTDPSGNQYTDTITINATAISTAGAVS